MKKFFTGIALVLTCALTGCGKESAPEAKKKDKVAAESAAKEKEALDTAVEAYVFAYPLVTMEFGEIFGPARASS
jgi:hypothetical protein